MTSICKRISPETCPMVALCAHEHPSCSSWNAESSRRPNILASHTCRHFTLSEGISLVTRFKHFTLNVSVIKNSSAPCVLRTPEMTHVVVSAKFSMITSCRFACKNPCLDVFLKGRAFILFPALSVNQRSAFRYMLQALSSRSCF